MGKCGIRVSESYIVAGSSVPNDDSLYYTFPTLTKCFDGSFLCCTLAGREKSGPDGRIKMFKSVDSCKTWIEIDSPTLQDEKEDSRYGYLMCHITEIRQGSLIAVYTRVNRFRPEEPLFHPITDGMQYCEVRITKSIDNGKTWTKPRTLDYRLPDLIIAGKCIKLQDGTLGISCEVWHEWDKGFREGPSSRLILSYDEGETWHKASIMAMDPMKESIFGDPRITILDDGRIVTLFWRYNLKTGVDMPIHRVESCNQGNNWSEPYNTRLIGQIANPFSLGNGRILCVFQSRFDDPGLKAVISHDCGMTWDMESMTAIWATDYITDNNNPFKGYQNYSFGYSSGIMLNENEFLITFWCSNGKTTYIKICKLNV